VAINFRHPCKHDEQLFELYEKALKIST